MLEKTTEHTRSSEQQQALPVGGVAYSLTEDERNRADMSLDAEKQTDFNASILRRGHHIWTRAHLSDDGSLQVRVRVWSENTLLGYHATSLVVFLDETTRIRSICPI